MLITPDQIRAARALKNWSQAELAQRVDMATPSIGNIEAGKHSPTPQTQSAIIEAFEAAGIEFIDGGVRKKQDLVQIYEGDDCYLRLLDDAFRTLAASKGEILFSGADERRSTQLVNEKTKAMRRSGIKMRFLVKDKNTHLMGRLDEYRWLPERLFVEGDVKVVYENNVAYLMSWNETLRVVTIKDPKIAEENRRIFQLLWESSAKPDKSTAGEFYDD